MCATRQMAANLESVQLDTAPQDILRATVKATVIDGRVVFGYIEKFPDYRYN